MGTSRDYTPASSRLCRAARQAGRRVCFAVLWCAASGFVAHGSSAENATWAANPASGDWNAAQNWSPATVPRGAGDVATFGSSAITSVALSAAVEVSAINFTASANPPFTITVPGATVLTLSERGIANSSGLTQNFVAAGDRTGGSRPGAILFYNDATAGHSTAFATTSGSVGGGFVRFHNRSTGGSATFTLEGGSVSFVDSTNAGSGFLTASRSGSIYFGGNASGASATLTINNGTSLTFTESSRAGNASITTNTYGETKFFQHSNADHARFVSNGAVTGGFLGAGYVRFYDNSTAAEATFLNAGATANMGSTGQLEFFDSSNAGRATVTNKGGSAANAGGGALQFRAGSRAGEATVVNDGGEVSGAFGGVTYLNDNSSAANGTFINNGGSAAGANGATTMFFGTSTAGASRLVANGGAAGAAGGSIEFQHGASGGTPRVELFGNGRLDIGNTNSGVAIGSLEGNGDVFLGARMLTVGTNDASSTFGGVIRDAGRINAAGGALTKIGAGTLVLSNANLYTGGTDVRAGKLIISNSHGSATGAGPARLAGAGALLGGTGTIAGPVVLNPGAALSPGDAASASGTLTLTADVTLSGGTTIELGLSARGQHATLARGGGNWSFATDQAFAIVDLGATPGLYDNVIAGLAADPGSVGSWKISTPGFAGTFSYDGAGGVDLNLTVTPPVLGNIATRMRVQTGENVLIAGFIITGTQQKKLLVRAIGPSLSLAGRLENPTLEIVDSSGRQVAFNDNWKEAANRQEISDSQAAPTNDFESAILTSLSPGSYTAVMRGVGETTGIGVVEAYDLDRTAHAKLANIATRGFVETEQDVMIAGFIVVAPNPRPVLIRAIGPSLSVAGKLANPSLDLVDGNGNHIGANDDWRSNQQAEIEATTVPPSNDLESAIIAFLPPGGYTAVVRGVSQATGVAVAEVYALE